MNDAEQNQGRNEPSLGAEPETPRRPNANYRLSRESAGSGEPTFYYSRERRLAKAPRAVRDLYKDEPPPRFNLLRPLIGSKPRAMMFGSIVLICLTMLVLSIFGYTGNTHSLAGNRLTVGAQKYQGTVVLSLTKTIPRGGLWGGGAPYTGAVDVAVSPANRTGDTPPVFFHRVFFSLAAAEEYRFSVPFDTEELLVVLQTEKNSLSLKIKVE